jgi:hypothetical protein
MEAADLSQTSSLLRASGFGRGLPNGAAGSVWGAKGLISARSSPARLSASRNFMTTSGWSGFVQTLQSLSSAQGKAQGILARLLMRELEESKYQVAEARRLSAAKLAALGTFPIRMVKLTDADPSKHRSPGSRIIYSPQEFSSFKHGSPSRLHVSHAICFLCPQI